MQENRPDRAGAGRLGLVGDVLLGALQRAGGDITTARVLDCGGGSGSFAVPLAVAGAAVTVLDISVDALATLQRRAEEAAVADRITALQGDVENLSAALGPDAEFDVVLAHDILDEVDAPAAVLTELLRRVRPGGLASVLVTNPVAVVLSRAMAGDLSGALGEMRRLDTDAGRLGPRGVAQLCRDAGLLLDQVSGIGVFTDLVPGSAVDTLGGREALAALEASAATLPPFSDIATRIHTLARRPARR